MTHEPPARIAAGNRENACKHSSKGFISDGYMLPLSKQQLAVTMKCLACWVDLPFGPATVTPEVAIEIRAAEIAAAIADGRSIVEVASRDEDTGWWAHEKELLYFVVSDNAAPGFASGWLARQIIVGDEP